MGLLDRILGRRGSRERKQRDPLTGRVASFDRTRSSGTIELADGRTLEFPSSACFFVPFVDLPVVVEKISDDGSKIEKARLAEGAHPRYTELLDQQAADDRERQARTVQEAEEDYRARMKALSARESVDEELETQIELGDDDALLVYADLLQEHGDPLGELIVLEHAVEDGTAADGTAARIAALRREFERDAGLRPDIVRVEWRRGLIESARVALNWPDVDMWDVDGDPLEALATLFGAPAARFLRKLTVGILHPDSGADYAGMIDTVIEEAGPLRALRELHVGDFTSMDLEMSWSGIEQPLPYASMPQLRRLILKGGDLVLGDISLPELEHLEVQTGGLSVGALSDIVRAECPKLTSLVIWFGDEGYGAECGAGDLSGLLGGGRFQRLTHLGLMNADFTDDICAALATCELAGRLRSLDLSMGVMSDAGAAALAAGADRFSALERLDVSDSYLTDAGIAQLRALPFEVIASDQKEADVDGDEAYRYVTVGE